MKKKRYFLIQDKIDGMWNCFELIPFTFAHNNFRGKTPFVK